ncbi:MAG: hypothetical protein Q8Q13_02645 [bacterium]|nr:hypothetical protein [bacterium]
MSDMDKPLRPQDLLERDEKTRQIHIERLQNEIGTLNQQWSEMQKRIEAGQANEDEMAKLQKDALGIQRAILAKRAELIEREKDLVWSSGDNKTRH